MFRSDFACRGVVLLCFVIDKGMCIAVYSLQPPLPWQGLKVHKCRLIALESAATAHLRWLREELEVAFAWDPWWPLSICVRCEAS